MITNQQQGIYSAGNAEYSGFGAFIAYSYQSTPVTPPPSSGLRQDLQTLGLIHQMGIDTLFDTSTGLV